jgi:hypothetical protein
LRCSSTWSIVASSACSTSPSCARRWTALSWASISRTSTSPATPSSPCSKEHRPGCEAEDDYAEAAPALEPGCSAALLVYENTWAAPLATALRRSGAQHGANGRIPVNAIIAALDELEQADA